MLSQWKRTFVVPLLVAVLAVSGCASIGKKQVSTPGEAQVKPPLVIPASFPSVAAKLQFATKATADGYYVEAKPLLEQALSANPDPVGYRHLGTAVYNLGDHTAAIAAWSKAKELDKALEGEMTNNIGNALRDSGKLEEAKEAYRKALKVEPTRWTAAINLASQLKQEAKLDEAIEVLESAVSINQDIKPLNDLLDALKRERKASAMS